MTISKMKTKLLNPEHEIYRILTINPPKWWTIVKSDPELYIEIRKGNEIMVYYRGGRAAGAKYHSRRKVIEVTAHPKYLGHIDKSDSRYYKQNDDHTPIYQPCDDWIIEKLDELKRNIITFYAGDDDGENTSEKMIQGSLIINNRNVYLDSEFAYRFHDEERKTIRMDLIKIVDGKFVFEELKRIVDARLRTTKGEPEIGIQMQNYKDFISANKAALTAYYRDLYNIKKNLQLPVPDINDIDSITVEDNPKLIIAENYDKSSDERVKRIGAIEGYLNSKGINYEFLR